MEMPNIASSKKKEVPDTTPSESVIYYGDEIPDPDPVVWPLTCVGNHHNQPVTGISGYSYQGFCEQCVKLEKVKDAITCGFCQVPLASSPQEALENKNCKKIIMPNSDVDYRCPFCSQGWVTKEEEFQRGALAGQTWFKLFLDAASKATSKDIWKPELKVDITLSGQQALLKWNAEKRGEPSAAKHLSGSSWFNKKEGKHEIRITSHLRPMPLMATVVHELTHCWQHENMIERVQSVEVLEGFAEWVAYQYLRRWFKKTKDPDIQAEIKNLAYFKRNRKDIYGQGLGRWLGYEKGYTLPKLLTEASK